MKLMKIFKNKIVQTVSVITLIAIIGVVVYISSDTKVKADDTVTMQYVKQEIEKLQTQINTLNITIEEQKTEISTLKSTNEDLKVKIDKLNYAEDIKGINNSITTINSKISKINAREDYFYKNTAFSEAYLPRVSRYINENLK
jgi:predicted RNase H-like nuclease (RuvC/YqgF family)